VPGKRYSAGAIFLQVVPVFANVQRAIEDEAKNIDRALGDQMEKSGEKAGERAGKAASKKMNEELRKGSGEFERDFHKNIDGINRALGGIDTKRLSNDLRKELTEVKRELAGLKDVDIAVDVDRRKADVALAELEGRTQRLRDVVKIIFRTDLDDALKGFGKIKAAKEAISDPVNIEVRTEPAERKMGAFEKSIKRSMDKAARHMDGSMNKSVRNLRNELDHLSKLRVNVDIGSAQLTREVAVIMAQLERLSHEDVDIDVKFEAGKAWAELAAWEAARKAADGRDIDVRVDLDSARAERGLFSLSRGGNDAANAFRSFNIVLLAAAGLGPALVPILGAIAGGLLAIGPAAAVAGAGLGTVIVGFSGIGDAVSALTTQQEQAALTGQTAAKTEINNARAVARARESAAEAIENALERQKNAQEAYADSITDVKDAEQALRDARAAAAGTGDDIGDRIDDNQLAQDQGLLDVFNTTVEFNAVMADGSATNAEQEQARINMEQAKRALEELREEAKELAKEKRKWDKEGVNGTDAVENAQDNLNDALDRQKDAYEALRDAAEDVDKARRDGAQSVADALENQADALAKVNAQQNAVNNAFAKLGPEGKAFSLFLFGLRDDFQDFRADVQKVLLPAVQEAMEGFMASPNGAIARDALIGLAEGFGEFVKLLSTSLQGEAWTGFFQMLADLGPDIQAAYGGAFVAFLEAMASILTALAPFALEFAEGFEKMMIAFAKWAASPEGQKAITDFMTAMADIAPDVLAFIGAFARGVAAVAVAMAPWGDLVLNALTGFFNLLDAMDPKVLSAILTGITILIVASQLAYGAIALLNAGTALLANPIGLVVFAIVGIIAAIAILYKTNEGFRDFMNEAWDRIAKVVSEAWDKHLKPALMDLVDALKQLWEEVLLPFFRWLGPVILWYIEHMLPLMIRYWSFLIHAIAWGIKHILIPVLKLWGDWMQFLWKHAFKPTIDHIREGWGHLMDAMAWAWDNVLKPIWDYITDTALPALETAFQNTVDAIGEIWAGLQALFATPIDFLLDGVINNGIIDGYNTVVGWVGADDLKLDHISIPSYINKHSAFATGGVLPGYTPGRDTHRFTSPTGGRLDLSGGEAIMRPEWTAAIGKDGVDYWNSVARSGGVKGVRKAMGFWKGGVLPLSNGTVMAHTSGYSGYAADLNWGSGYDDFGRMVRAWKDGIVAQMQMIGDQSYGRWAVLNHEDGVSSLYAHLSKFAKIAVGEKVSAGQTIGYVGDLGNTGTPPTSHLHFEINGGAAAYADNVSQGADHRAIPSWLMKIVKDPLGAVKGWITKPFDSLPGAVLDTPFLNVAKRLPPMMASAVTDSMWDIIPGWVKTAAGWAGDAADYVVGGVKAVGHAVTHPVETAQDVGGWVSDHFKDGGVLPYNGTMMYDNGGYLPPGLTTVMNLTGKPEPVFTDGQWQSVAGGGVGGNIHYEPHFEGSNLTPEDVAADLNFTFKRIKRSGKYEGVGS
jgi:hypothetical protein